FPTGRPTSLRERVYALGRRARAVAANQTAARIATPATIARTMTSGEMPFELFAGAAATVVPGGAAVGFAEVKTCCTCSGVTVTVGEALAVAVPPPGFA